MENALRAALHAFKYVFNHTQSVRHVLGRKHLDDGQLDELQACLPHARGIVAPNTQGAELCVKYMG